MKKKTAVVLLAMFAMALMVPALALASEGGDMSDAKLGYYGFAALGATIGIGLAAIGTGVGMGSGLAKACEGVARNPGVMNKIMTMLIIGIAMIESLAIYALVVILIVLFANPFGV